MSRARDFADLAGSADAGGLTGRNLIINGAMQVAQRGTSVTGSTAGGAFHTVDRFANHGSDATYDSTQESVTLGGETGLPVQFKNYHKFNVTTGANNSGIWQTIEGVDRVQGKHTLSFYAKGVNPAGGVVALETRQYFGSSGSSEIDVDIDTFVLTSSWQRFTFTFDVASVSGKTIAGGNDYFRVFLHQPEGDAGTAAWNLQITGVQLEVGEQATPFEHRSFADELQRCMRYYEKSYDYDTAPGTTAAYPGNLPLTIRGMDEETSGQRYFVDNLKVEKRADPTNTYYDEQGNTGKVTTYDSGGTGTHNVSIGLVVTESSKYGAGPGNSAIWGFGFFYECDAEL